MVKNNIKKELIPLKVPKKLLKEFPEPASQFPTKWNNVLFLGGRTIAKIGTWHKAAILVQNDRGLQIRFYGWNYNKDREKWSLRQTYNISSGSLSTIYEVLDAFARCLEDLRNSPKEEN